MQKIQASVPNNGAFVWTLDFSAVAASVDLTTATVRMWIKTNATDASPLLAFSTSGDAGSIIYNSTAKTCQFLAASSLIAGIFGVQNFDIRVETPAGNYIVTAGQITFTKGITTAAVASSLAAASRLDDTVSVLSATTIGSASMAAIPLSFTSAFDSLMGVWLASRSLAVAMTFSGVVTDGSTDATAAIAAAAAATIVQGKASLLFTEGTYLVDGLTLPGGLEYKAIGDVVFKRKNAAASNFVVQFSSVSNFSLNGFIFDGNAANQTLPANNVLINNCCAYSIEQNAFRNAFGPTNYGDGLYVLNSTDSANNSLSTIRDNKAYDNGQDGICVGGGSWNLSILTNECYSNGGNGINVENYTFPPVADVQRYLNVSDNYTYNNAGCGIELLGFIKGGTPSATIYGPGVEAIRSIIVMGNQCSSNKHYGLGAQVSEGVIDSNICESNGGTGNAYAGILANCEYSILTNNICNGNEFYGIDAGGAYHVAILDNICNTNGAPSTSGLGCGINAGAARYFDLAGNRCESNGGANGGSQIQFSRIDSAGAIAFPAEGTVGRIRDNYTFCANLLQVGIAVLDDPLKIEVTDNKCAGAIYSNQFVIQSTDCLVRGNHGDETSALMNGYVSGAATLVLPDWTDEMVVVVNGTSTLAALTTYTINRYVGGVYNVRVTGATGWTSAPTVSFTGGGGSGATAHALIDNTGAVWIIVDNPGSGYTSAPALALTGGGGAITGYTVTISPTNLISGKRVQLMFTSALTLNRTALLNLSAASITTTGRSLLTLKGFAGEFYEESLISGMS